LGKRGSLQDDHKLNKKRRGKRINRGGAKKETTSKNLALTEQSIEVLIADVRSDWGLPQGKRKGRNECSQVRYRRGER